MAYLLHLLMTLAVDFTIESSTPTASLTWQEESAGAKERV
jgi:hypothetical protein